MGGGRKQQTQIVRPSPELQPYLTDILKRGKAASEEKKQFFPRKTFADFNQRQITGQNKQVAFANGGAEDLFANSNQALTQILQQADPNSIQTQNLIKAVVDPLETRLRTNVLPGLSNRGIASGNFGSARQSLAENQALGTFGREAGNVAARVVNDAQKLALSGISQAPTVGRLGLLPGQILQDVGKLEQGQTQRQINEDIQRFNFDQNELDARLNQYKNLIGGLPFGQSTTVTGKSGGGLGQGLLGAALLASNFITPGAGAVGAGLLNAGGAALGAGGGFGLIGSSLLQGGFR